MATVSLSGSAPATAPVSTRGGGVETKLHSLHTVLGRQVEDIIAPGSNTVAPAFLSATAPFLWR